MNGGDQLPTGQVIEGGAGDSPCDLDQRLANQDRPYNPSAGRAYRSRPVDGRLRALVAKEHQSIRRAHARQYFHDRGLGGERRCTGRVDGTGSLRSALDAEHLVALCIQHVELDAGVGHISGDRSQEPVERREIA